MLLLQHLIYDEWRGKGYGSPCLTLLLLLPWEIYTICIDTYYIHIYSRLLAGQYHVCLFISAQTVWMDELGAVLHGNFALLFSPFSLSRFLFLLSIFHWEFQDWLIGFKCGIKKNAFWFLFAKQFCTIYIINLSILLEKVK